jgi:hypothetical protein
MLKIPAGIEKRYLVDNILPFLAQFLKLRYQVCPLVTARDLW